MRYKRWLFLVAGIILSFAQAFSQNFTDEKKYVHQFPLTDKTTVDISNKYGKVQILTWDKDSVRVDIDFFISSNSLTRLNKLRQSINFDYSNSNMYVMVKTSFGRSQSNVIDELKDFADALVNGSNEIRIDYIVHIPQNQIIKVANKYGDIYADDLTGDVQLNLSNGDLKANDLNGNTQISLSFGNAFISEFTRGRILAEYGDLNIRSANDISLETKSSKVNIEKAQDVKLKSRRDDYQIEEVNSVTGDGYFSNINIQNLTDELNFSAKFGKIVVDNFRNSFSFVNVNTEYADIDLYFAQGSAFDYDISYYKDALIRLPKEAEEDENKAINPEMTQRVMYGRVGKNSANSKVKIVAPKKCYLNLYLK